MTDSAETIQPGFLQDDAGNNSTMRAMSIVSLIAAILTAVILLIRPPADPYSGLYIFTAFLVGAFVPKAIQKFAEVKVPMK